MDRDTLIHKERYQIAAKRVKRIKGFYRHALIYAIVNLVLFYINFQNLDEGESYFQWRNFITFSFWGIGVLSHAASVFLPNLIFGKGWEARRMKKYMEKEDSRWE
jgi:hypothetical protein